MRRGTSQSFIDFLNDLFYVSWEKTQYMVTDKSIKLKKSDRLYFENLYFEMKDERKIVKYKTITSRKQYKCIQILVDKHKNIHPRFKFFSEILATLEEMLTAYDLEIYKRKQDVDGKRKAELERTDILAE